jgi:hypothetical protein
MERSENKTKKKQKTAIIFALKRNEAKRKRNAIIFALKRNEAKWKRKTAFIFALKRNEKTEAKFFSLRCTILGQFKTKKLIRLVYT